MGRHKLNRGKIVRRLGINVFGNPKFDKLLDKKPNGPGQAPGGRRRKQPSDFGKKLVEKQKLKYTYDVSEGQLRRVYQEAKRMGGNTGNNMLSLLERRIDNVLYRCGMAGSRQQARQMLSHGHVYFNGKKMNIPSLQVKKGDKFTAKDKEQSKKLVKQCIEENDARIVPDWVSVDRDGLAGEIVRMPEREEVPTTADELLVVEYYAR